MLGTIMILPLLGAMLISPLSDKHAGTMKRITLATMMATFLVSIVMYYQFDNSVIGYQFTQEINHTSFAQLYLGVDGISLYFILLTTFIMPFSILSSWYNTKHNIKYFLICFLVLEAFLVATFSVCDLILFYVFFESVLIPLYILIIIFGARKCTYSSWVPTVSIYTVWITVHATILHGYLLPCRFN